MSSYARSCAVRDGVIARLIGKWLHAGVMEGGVLVRAKAGPLKAASSRRILANIFLHEVLDVWFAQEVLPRLRGSASLVRYADDAVMLFRYEEDAPTRRGRAPEEIRALRSGAASGQRRWLMPFPTSGCGTVRRQWFRQAGYAFDFLGFTIHWGKSFHGKWVVKMRTAQTASDERSEASFSGARPTAMLRWRIQQKVLGQKLRGHYGYYNRRGNRRRVWDFLYRVVCAWWHWLRHRSRGLALGGDAEVLRRYPLPSP